MLLESSIWSWKLPWTGGPKHDSKNSIKKPCLKKLIKRSDNTSTRTNKTKYLIPILTTVIILGTPFFGALGIFLLSGPQALSPQIQSIKNHLDAGKDVNSKDMYENLVPIQQDWNGYGPWDWFSLMVTEYAKSKGVDFQQYILRGQTIFEYPVGPLLDGGFTKMYKDLLHINDVPNQRQLFESKMEDYVNKGIQSLHDKKIL